MSRLNPEKADFAVRIKAKQLAWPIARTEIVRIGDPVTESRPGTGIRTREWISLRLPGRRFTPRGRVA